MGRREVKKGTEKREEGGGEKRRGEREEEERREKRSDDEECEEGAFGITHHMQVRVSIVLYIIWVVQIR